MAKICGIRNLQEAFDALDGGANTIGLLVVPTAEDRVSVAEAKHICSAVHQKYPRARVVLVTHEWSFAKAAEVLGEIGADAIQVHDYISPYGIIKLQQAYATKMLRHQGFKDVSADKLVSADLARRIEQRHSISPSIARDIIGLFARHGFTATNSSGFLKKRYTMTKEDSRRLGDVYSAVATEYAKVRRTDFISASPEIYKNAVLAQSIGLTIDEAKDYGFQLPKVEVFKAIHIRDDITSLDAALESYAKAIGQFARSYVTVAGVDALLVDTIENLKDGRSRIGGTGKRPHPDAARAALQNLVGLPLILAGGLTPDNVGRAVRESARECTVPRTELSNIPGCSPIVGIDVNTGVEAPDKSKSPRRIREFVLQGAKALAETELKYSAIVEPTRRAEKGKQFSHFYAFSAEAQPSPA
jgi:phosphoribosylanthranilate isomerase